MSTTPTPYTPTDEDMAHWFEGEEDPEKARALWNRWLAARDARVRAEAVREAHQYAGERGSGNVYVDLLDFADREEARAASIEQETQG